MPDFNERSVRLGVDMLKAADRIEQMTPDEIRAMLRQAAAVLVQSGSARSARRPAVADSATAEAKPETPAKSEPVAAVNAPPNEPSRKRVDPRLQADEARADWRSELGAVPEAKTPPAALPRSEPVAASEPSEPSRKRVDWRLQAEEQRPEPPIDRTAEPKPEAPRKREPAVSLDTAPSDSPRRQVERLLEASRMRLALRSAPVIPADADAWLETPAKREPIVAIDAPPAQPAPGRFNWPLFGLAFAIGFVTLVSAVLLIGRGTGMVGGSSGPPAWSGDDWLTVTLAGFVAVQIVFGLVAVPMLRPVWKRRNEERQGD